MAEYSFVTIWRIEAQINAVWDAIMQSKRWPEWWKYVESVVELEPGDENGVGGLQRLTWTTALPYKLSFDSRAVQIEKPFIIEGRVNGELSGSGRWQLSQEGAVTTVRNDWNVGTTKAWMNLLAPLISPIFEWNHTTLMSEGGRSLARLLNTRLLEVPAQKSAGLPRLLGALGVVGVLVLATRMAYVIFKRDNK